jgi:hypothetical protein
VLHSYRQKSSENRDEMTLTPQGIDRPNYKYLLIALLTRELPQVNTNTISCLFGGLRCRHQGMALGHSYLNASAGAMRAADHEG